MIMQRKNIKIAGILLLMSIMLMTSCSDYLDVSKELSKNLDH